MEVKTKFNVYQEVFSVKEEYCKPAIVKTIRIDVMDYYSRDIYPSIIYELEGVTEPIDEELLAGSKEEWVAAKIQAEMDKLESIKTEIERLKNQQ